MLSSSLNMTLCLPTSKGFTFLTATSAALVELAWISLCHGVCPHSVLAYEDASSRLRTRMVGKKSPITSSPGIKFNSTAYEDKIEIPPKSKPHKKQMSCHKGAHLARRPHRKPQNPKRTKTEDQLPALSHQGPRSAKQRKNQTRYNYRSTLTHLTAKGSSTQPASSKRT
ncbi:hypothetical protein AVEN_247036-1 [Araneus ventricosus]|uniref:Uncharacterized protein n=1 Tax=Araneus ventricosus TaxID=182803 RepID=A0A4Y2U7H6_ARAVE|nr:hypothetical protein AVEN_247036-1 [Araneus ventricosus]